MRTSDSRFAHFLDQFQTLPYNSLIFGTLVQHGGNSTAHGWVHGAEQVKSRRTVNFQKLCDFTSLSNVETHRKNERTVSYYFQSQWCLSEWRTFQERERLYHRDLILPASYHDGESFPHEAREKQMADFRNYTSTVPTFWSSQLAQDFEMQRLKTFAHDLAVLIHNAPPYDEGFPIIEATDNEINQENVIGRIANT